MPVGPSASCDVEIEAVKQALFFPFGCAALINAHDKVQPPVAARSLHPCSSLTPPPVHASAVRG